MRETTEALAAEKGMIRLEAGIARRFKIVFPGLVAISLGRRATPASKHD
jgi:hypothetical protein